jgi:hypothetical protein
VRKVRIAYCVHFAMLRDDVAYSVVGALQPKFLHIGQEIVHEAHEVHEVLKFKVFAALLRQKQSAPGSCVRSGGGVFCEWKALCYQWNMLFYEWSICH